MNRFFADMLKKLRAEKGLLPQASVDKMSAASPAARRETGTRLPEARSTADACGFALKPVTHGGVKEQSGRLHNPFFAEADEL